MLQEINNSLRQPVAAGINLISRVNAALDAIDLGLQRARRPIITTKFGHHSAIILHLISQVRPKIPVIWVDSGFNTKDTVNFSAALAENLDLNLHIYRPKTAWSDAIPKREDPLHEAFVEQIKLEPFNQALAEHQPDVWFTALRREQTQLRDGLSLFQTTDQGILKVCPLLDWRSAEMDTYLVMHQLASGHDYFDPTKTASHLECGLHERF